VWLHSKEEHVTVLHGLLVVQRQVHPYLLQEYKASQPASGAVCSQSLASPPSQESYM
jgi:hypothetical protein